MVKIRAEMLNQNSSKDCLNYFWFAHLLNLLVPFILEAIYIFFVFVTFFCSLSS